MIFTFVITLRSPSRGVMDQEKAKAGLAQFEAHLPAASHTLPCRSGSYDLTFRCPLINLSAYLLETLEPVGICIRSTFCSCSQQAQCDACYGRVVRRSSTRWARAVPHNVSSVLSTERCTSGTCRPSHTASGFFALLSFLSVSNFRCRAWKCLPTQ